MKASDSVVHYYFIQKQPSINNNYNVEHAFNFEESPLQMLDDSIYLFSSVLQDYLTILQHLDVINYIL
jgi:hypothetical protein